MVRHPVRPRALLHDKVNDDGPLGAAELASIGAALSEGLVAVHEAGVVHRDLKPSNILLSPKGPRIIDFGIAWATGASTLTHVGTAVGSPGFLAPEQVRGALVTPATDVFSLGATLAYASTADSPFGQGSSEVMLYRVVHEEPQLHGVPDALAPLVRACLAKDPEERPSTLDLSLRLKEIATRESQGMADARPPVPRTAEADRPTGRLSDHSHPERTLRQPGGPGTPPPRGGRRPRAGRFPRGAGLPFVGEALREAAVAAVPRRRGRGPGRCPVRATPVPAAAVGRPPRGGRPGPRTTGTGLRPANPRLLRQRLFVFVVVTLLVALGIAVVQGCEGPARGLGGDDGVVRQDVVRQEPGHVLPEPGGGPLGD